MMTRSGPFTAEVTGDQVAIHMGWIGHAEIPLARITRISGHKWPWFGGVGVRIGKGLVAFVPTPGPATMIELDEPITVHAPAPWETRRVIVAVEDAEGFAAAIAAARAPADS